MLISLMHRVKHMTDVISPKDLLHKRLINLIVEFVPDFPTEGVCNGGVSMWTQAVLTSKQDLKNFYQRLDDLIEYFEVSDHSPAMLKQTIDDIYETRAKNKITTNLTDDELRKVEIRAFAEAVAVQQEPEIIFNHYHQNMKAHLYPLTASKKNQDQQIVLANEYLGVLIPTIEELEYYFNSIMPILLSTSNAEPNIVFHLNSNDHTVGIYLDTLSKKWHFFDLSTLNKNNYYHEVDFKKLSYLIFSAFDDDGVEKLENYHAFSIRAIFSKGHPKLITDLKAVTQHTLSKDFYNRCTSKMITALTIACQDAELNTISFLLKNGAKNCININNDQGFTPLFFLIKNDSVEIVKLLFQYGGTQSIHLTNFNNDTPLLFAAKQNKLTMLSLLLKHGASQSIFIANNQGNTALSYACHNGYFEVADELLQHGANPDSTNLQEFSPLYYASQNGHTDIVKLLIQYGAKPNLKTKDNSTPLWIACQNGHTNIVNLLLKYGSLDYIHASDNDGITPYMVAKAFHHEDIVMLLEQAQVAAKPIFTPQLALVFDKGIRKRKVENDLKKDDNNKKLKTNDEDEKIHKSICPCAIM